VFPSSHGYYCNRTCILLQGKYSLHILLVHMGDKGYKLTASLFTRLRNASSDRIQVLGLCSVLIATVAFAAAFTIPGGYNQDNGTPILARRYMFNAFILANALAFMTAYLSIFVLFIESYGDPDSGALEFASNLFLLASSSMVVSFGLGMYVTLAPNNMPIAILIFVSSLFLSSPLVFLLYVIGQKIILFILDAEGFRVCLLTFVASYGLIFVVIFCLAFL
jgi:Domain of unknown function